MPMLSICVPSTYHIADTGVYRIDCKVVSMLNVCPGHGHFPHAAYSQTSSTSKGPTDSHVLTLSPLQIQQDLTSWKTFSSLRHATPPQLSNSGFLKCLKKSISMRKCLQRELPITCYRVAHQDLKNATTDITSIVQDQVTRPPITSRFLYAR